MAERLQLKDQIAQLSKATPARLGQGRSGVGLPTQPLLDYQLDLARSRDAVWAKLDLDALAGGIDFPTIKVRSEAPNREIYLKRPDLGRMLNPTSARNLPTGPFDLAFSLADGLSAKAVQQHGPPLIAHCLHMRGEFSIGPIALVEQGRVAVGDDIGACMRARISVIMIGERPGLSAPDSMSIYITYEPRRGRRDYERNCISSIHGNGGLGYAAAADKLFWLLNAALRLKLTGIDLKDEQHNLSFERTQAETKVFNDSKHIQIQSDISKHYHLK